MSKQYYSVGYRENCGHKHRTRSGAERCARRFLWESRDDLRDEAVDHGMTRREYIAEIVHERTGDCFICLITVQD